MYEYKVLRGHAWSQILFFYFYCLQCFRDAFLVINRGLSVSLKVINEDGELKILCHVNTRLFTVFVYMYIASIDRLRFFSKLIFLSLLIRFKHKLFINSSYHL